MRSKLQMQSLVVLLLACVLPLVGWTAAQPGSSSQMPFSLHVLDAFQSSLLDQGSLSKPVSTYNQTLRESATGQLFALSRCDYSYCLLENMFGEIPGVMGTRVSQASKPYCRWTLGSVQSELVDIHGNSITPSVLGKTTAAIAYYFNIGLISILFILVAYQVFFDAMLSPSLDGDISDRNFSIYKVIRIVSGLSLVAPYFESGYSLLQSMLMYIILLGVGFGDQILTQGLLQSHLLDHQTVASIRSAQGTSDTDPCQTSNVAVGAYNYGWIHAGYLYPTLLSGLSTESQDNQWSMPDFISIIYRLFGMRDDAASSVSAGSNTETVTLSSSTVEQIANIIQSKNCLTAQMLFEGEKNSSCVKARLNGNTLDALSATQLVSIVNACANLTMTFSGDVGKQTAVLSFNDNVAKPSNQSCGTFNIPAGLINQSAAASLASNTQTVSFETLNQYMTAGVNTWFSAIMDIADQLFVHFYQAGNVCATQASLDEQEKQLCNTFGRFPSACPSGTNCSTPEVLQDSHAITSGYGYRQYLLNGTRSTAGSQDAILHENDFILYRDLAVSAPLSRFEGSLSVSDRALQAGIRPSCSNAGTSLDLSSIVCSAKNIATVSGTSTLSEITRPDNGTITGDYLFNHTLPPRIGLNAAMAIRMVRYALLPQEDAQADGRFVPTLYSEAMQFVHAVNESPGVDTSQAKTRVANHLDGATAFLLRSIYPNQPFSFLEPVDGGIRFASRILSGGLFSSPNPPSAKNMHTVMHMVLSRVLGAYYYPRNNDITTKNFHSPPSRSKVCVDAFQQYCQLHSYAGCFKAMKQAGCIRNGQGLLAAAETAQSFIEGSGRAIPYYSPFADFVGMGAEILRATSLFLSVNTRQLQDQMFNAQKQSMEASVVQFGLQAIAGALIGNYESKIGIVTGRVGLMIAQSAGEWSQFLIGYLQNAVMFYSTIATTLIMVLFPIGMLMAIMIPFYPVLVFTMGVIGWLISVMEAMISAPIIAVGLAHPDGHDFFGRSGSAVMLTLSTALRPVLMVLGVFFSVMALQYLFLLFHIGMVENIYFLTSGVYGTVALNDPQLMLFLIVGILVLYAFTGWELVSQICMMTVALAARILMYLGGQEEDLRAIQGAVSNVKQQASQIGDSLTRPVQGVGENFARTSTSTLQALPKVVSALPDGWKGFSSLGAFAVRTGLLRKKGQSWKDALNNAHKKIKGTFSEEFDTSEFRGQARMYNSNIAKQAYKEQALKRLKKGKYFDPGGYRSSRLEAQIDGLKKDDSAWGMKGMRRKAYSRLMGDAFAERLVPKLSQADKLFLQEQSRKDQDSLLRSTQNTTAAWLHTFGTNVDNAENAYKRELPAELSQAERNKKISNFRDYYDAYVVSATSDNPDLQKLKSEITTDLDSNLVSQFLSRNIRSAPDVSDYHLPLINPLFWGQYLRYGVQTGGINLVRFILPEAFKNSDEELLTTASAAQLKAYAIRQNIPATSPVFAKIQRLQKEEEDYIISKVKRQPLPNVDRKKTLVENIRASQQTIIDSLGEGSERQKYMKKRLSSFMNTRQNPEGGAE